ncbi:MAG TPA: hypothetical protein VIX80_05945 [Candidatus Kapabacteria bacterium]
MPRLFFIVFLLVGVVTMGYSSRQYFKGIPVRIAPIANSESFYAVDAEDPSAETNFRTRKTLVRIEPDGTIHTIREIDAALEMSEDVAEESRIVMLGTYGTPPRLYNVTTGELSDVPKGYLRNDNWPEIKGSNVDSLKSHPLLKDLQNLRIFLLPQPDCYLVRATIPGTGGCIATYEKFDSTGGMMSYSTMSPRIYWSVANMKRNTLMKVGDDAPPSLSASGKYLLFHPDDENRKYYPHFVSLEEYVK